MTEVLLIHSDQSEGSPTSIIDSSVSEHTVTAYGGAVHSTTQSKFGSTSIYFSNTQSSLIAMPYSTDFNFGSDDFTIDTWIYPLTSSAWRRLFCSGTLAQAFGFTISINDTDNIAFWDSTSASYTTTTGTITENTWQHIAIVGYDGTVSFYFDGVADATTKTQGTLPNAHSSNPFSIGRVWDQTTAAFQGYMDEIRILKGVAAWTENFTPPISSYSSEIAFTPAITTNAASLIDTETARLNGTVSDMGGQASLEVGFDHGETTEYGTRTELETITGPGDFHADLTSLDPNTTYHAQAVAKEVL